MQQAYFYIVVLTTECSPRECTTWYLQMNSESCSMFQSIIMALHTRAAIMEAVLLTPRHHSLSKQNAMIMTKTLRLILDINIDVDIDIDGEY